MSRQRRTIHTIVRPNRFNGKTMYYVWRDREGVFYCDLTVLDVTVNTSRYQLQLNDLNHSLLEILPEYQRRQYKVIFFHDNAP